MWVEVCLEKRWHGLGCLLALVRLKVLDPDVVRCVVVVRSVIVCERMTRTLFAESWLVDFRVTEDVDSVFWATRGGRWLLEVVRCGRSAPQVADIQPDLSLCQSPLAAAIKQCRT